MTTSFIVCPGNTLKKYALFSAGVCVLEMIYHCPADDCTQTVRAVQGSQTRQVLSQSEFSKAFSHAAAEANSYIKQNRLAPVTQVVLQVAVSGTYFQQHRQVTDDFIAELKNKEKTSPQQVLPVLRELKFSQTVFPTADLYAASDTAFHATLPAHARQYSLSPELTKALDVYKFGANGLQVESVVRRVHAVVGIDPERLIVCHIADNTSVTAVYKGRSVETKGGFELSSGFPSAAQAGEIDVAAVLQIMKAKNLRAAEGELLLNTQGGWRAMAGAADIQTLLQRADQNDELAQQALRLFTYKLQQAIASAVAALQGVDAVVFTGSTGVQSPELRSAILQQLAYAQMKINEERNSAMCGKDGVISERNSAVKLLVLKGDEMGEINSVVKKIQLNSATKTTAL